MRENGGRLVRGVMWVREMGGGICGGGGGGRRGKCSGGGGGVEGW